MTEHLIYSGRVQGVGFRYTVRSLARRRPIAGYVKNLPDGTVELVVAGELAAINALLADVCEAFRGQIAGCQRRTLAAAEAFSGFEIRF